MKSRSRSRRSKRSKKGSKAKRSRSRKISSRYTYFIEDEPHDELRIKNCHKSRWTYFPGGVKVRSQPHEGWCKEAKHFLKSLKKSKSKRSRK